MKGDAKVLETLNALLADELTAINQYMVHSEMCADWGYEKLHKYVEGRAITEMRHAEAHIARILFLEGTPNVTKLNKIHIGADVKTQLDNDHAAELDAIKSYNAAIAVAVAAKDNGTRQLLEATLKDEEDHIDWIEAQQDIISQIGIERYLIEQID